MPPIKLYDKGAISCNERTRTSGRVEEVRAEKSWDAKASISMRARPQLNVRIYRLKLASWRDCAILISSKSA